VDENWAAHVGIMKDPRGILDYDLKGREKADVTWKMAGNLGGEQYRDLACGPLNEGAMYAERHGDHLPGSPLSQWEEKSPISDGTAEAGVGLFSYHFYIPSSSPTFFFYWNVLQRPNKILQGLLSHVS
jgi:hypothetical protein